LLNTKPQKFDKKIIKKALFSRLLENLLVIQLSKTRDAAFLDLDIFNLKPIPPIPYIITQYAKVRIIKVAKFDIFATKKALFPRLLENLLVIQLSKTR